jgi:hypothetical protein
MLNRVLALDMERDPFCQQEAAPQETSPTHTESNLDCVYARHGDVNAETERRPHGRTTRQGCATET